MTVRYQLSGSTLEGCNCPSPCPCSTACPTERCDVATAWHIDQGRAGNTSLDGLSVVGIYHTPDAPGGEFRANLYIDDTANPEQRTALAEIFAGRWGGQMGLMRQAGLQIKEVQYVPIEYERRQDGTHIRIPGVLSAALEQTHAGPLLSDGAETGVQRQL